MGPGKIKGRGNENGQTPDAVGYSKRARRREGVVGEGVPKRRGRVTVNGERCLDLALRVPPGAVVVVDERAPKLRTGVLPESAIVFVDRDVVVVDKPPGMLSIAYEPGDKDTLVDCTRTLLRRTSGRGLGSALGVVARLP